MDLSRKDWELLDGLIYQNALEFMTRLDRTDQMWGYDRKNKLNFCIHLVFARYELDPDYVNLFAYFDEEPGGSEIELATLLGGYTKTELLDYVRDEGYWGSNTYEQQHVIATYMIQIKNGMPVQPNKNLIFPETSHS